MTSPVRSNRSFSRVGHAALPRGLIVLVLLLSACRGASPPTGPVASPWTNPPVSPPAPVPTTVTGVPSLPDNTTLPPAQPATPSATPPPAGRVTLAPADLQGVQIQFWHPWSGAAGQALQALADEFTAANEWGVRVEAVYVGNYDALDERVRAALQAGAPPDLAAALAYQAAAWDSSSTSAGTPASPLETPSPQASLEPSRSPDTGQTAPPAAPTPATTPSNIPATPTSPAEAPADPVVVNLDDYINDPTWGLSAEEQADFYPAFWQADVLEGKRLGLPALRSAQVLYYNVTWAQALGFAEPPATPEQFQVQACAGAQANLEDADPQNDGTGGWLISTEPAALAGWLYAFDADFVPAGPSGYRFDTQEVRDALHFLRQLYDAGCAWLPTGEPPEAEFAARQGLFAAGSLGGLAHQEQVFQRADSRDEWTVLPFPSRDGRPAISAFGPSYVILETSPERQLAAWVFARWLAQPENGASLARAASALPVRIRALQQLSAASSGTAQEAAALALLPAARPEPPLASWGDVRWAIGDAATQLFRYYFVIDQVPNLAELLDDTAQELNERAP